MRIDRFIRKMETEEFGPRFLWFDSVLTELIESCVTTYTNLSNQEIRKPDHTKKNRKSRKKN